MATKIELKVLNELLDLYEKSKTFLGENKNHQRFKVTVSKLFPKYDDDSDFYYYKEINSTLEILKSKGFIFYNAERSGKIKTVFLQMDAINSIYEYLNRCSKSDKNAIIYAIWNSIRNQKDLDRDVCSPLLNYIAEQEVRLKKNKNIQFFNNNLTDYKNMLMAAKSILENDEDIFIRELSVKLFNNSKKLELLETLVRSLLFKYGEYDDIDTVFEEHNVVKTPTYVFLKGIGIIDCGQKINLEQISGDIGLSTQTLKSLKSIELNGASVITIENLTSFHKYQPQNELAIYLGGFHNAVKRDFIKLVKKYNPSSLFRHFGDIDAGGFYILSHLREKTEINFIPFKMDIRTLEDNKSCWIELSENDKKRLKLLANKSNCFEDVIDFMLENNCKLEQEAISFINKK